MSATRLKLELNKETLQNLEHQESAAVLSGWPWIKSGVWTCQGTSDCAPQKDFSDTGCWSDRLTC